MKLRCFRMWVGWLLDGVWLEVWASEKKVYPMRRCELVLPGQTPAVPLVNLTAKKNRS